MEESNITSEILPTEQESIANEGSSGERESTITYGTGDGEEVSLMPSEQSAIEQESTIANTSDTIGADSSIHKVTQVDDLNVGHDATIGGTLKAYKESLPKSDRPVKDGTGIYSDGAAYAYTPTQIEKDTTNISLGVLGLRLLNAAGVAVGGWTDIPVGMSDKDRAGIDAGMSQLLAAISGKYLRKDSPDTAQGVITFLKGAKFGEFRTGLLTGNGATIDENGNGELQNLSVRGQMKIAELILNQLQLVRSDYYFTENGTVDSVQNISTDADGNTTCGLVMRKEGDKDVTAFADGDILYGSVNNLLTTGEKQDAWVRVEHVDTDTNTLTVTLYPGKDVPGGVNTLPTSGMVVARRGNAWDATRQSSWYLSSSEKALVFLDNVDKPIIKDYNRAGYFGVGKVIADMYPEIANALNSNQTYLYTRGIVVQDIIRVGYKGKPVYTTRDRGPWDATVTYVKGKETMTDESGVQHIGYYTDCAWYGGCFWRCDVAQSTVGKPPRWNNNEWTCIIGLDNVTINITSSDGDFFNVAKGISTTLTATVTHAEMELTEEELGAANIIWTRDSGNVDDDVIWNSQHKAGTVGLSLPVTSADMPPGWGAGSKVGFRCAITVATSAAIKSYTGEYAIIN